MSNGQASTAQPTQVPNLVNKKVKEAKQLLGDIPLKIGSPPAPPLPSLDEDKIKSQDPEAGMDVPARPLPEGYFVGVILYKSPSREKL